MLYFIILNSPINPYDRNLLTADKAILVTAPVVSSDLIASKNGARKFSGEINFKSSIFSTDSLSSLNDFARPSGFSY